MSGDHGPGPAPGPPPAVHETHLSWITLLGDRAYKVLKPVDLGFVDHRDRAARRRALVREWRINRRFAPDIYLGVLDVVDADDEPCEHVLAMRRLPADRSLAALLAAPEAAEHVRRVAAAVAALHARCPLAPDPHAVGTPERRRADWHANRDQMARHAPGVIDPDAADAAVALADRYLEGRGPLFAARIADGWVRDGHGDLLAADTYCLDDGPRFLDCLAFDDDLRAGDVLADIAFLAMDIEHRGHPGLARALIATWAEALGESHPASLAHQHTAYRAQVRAKVTAMRASGGDPGATAEARALHRLAEAHLQAGRVRVVLVGGTPGTGKSTIARALAERTGWTVLRTDAMRPAVVGEGDAAGFGRGRYAREARAAVYAAMLAEARTLLGMGRPVILDASWGAAEDREAARGTAAAAAADLVELRCDAPAAVADARIAARRPGADPSQATPAVAAALRAAADPWPEATTVPTDRPLPESVGIAVEALGLPDLPMDL